jgi:hypothetical protein
MNHSWEEYESTEGVAKRPGAGSGISYLLGVMNCELAAIWASLDQVTRSRRSTRDVFETCATARRSHYSSA